VIDLAPFLDGVERIVARHAAGAPGRYARFTMPGDDEAGAPRDLGPNAYGCADAANLLWTIGRFPEARVEREAWIASLRAL
jgi:hypothetical protein